MRFCAQLFPPHSNLKNNAAITSKDKIYINYSLLCFNNHFKVDLHLQVLLTLLLLPSTVTVFLLLGAGLFSRQIPTPNFCNSGGWGISLKVPHNLVHGRWGAGFETSEVTASSHIQDSGVRDLKPSKVLAPVKTVLDSCAISVC